MNRPVVDPTGNWVVVLTAVGAAVAALTAEWIPMSLILSGLITCSVLLVIVASIRPTGAAVVRPGPPAPTAGASRFRSGGVSRVRGRGVAVILVMVLLVLLVGLRAHQDLAGLEAVLPDRVEGIATLGSDPETSRYGTDAELLVGGRRWAGSFDRSVEASLEGLRAGDRVSVDADVRAFEDAPEGWVRSRHLAGRLEVAAARAVGGTLPWYRAANGVHELLARGAASMAPEQRSLYLGLVVGDDRGQSELTRFRFRASGLTHLLAVSGQNLVFVLAVLAPLLRRLPSRSRWVLSVLAVAGFVLVTRAEPSVLRAATMTLLALTANLGGRGVSGVRTVGMAVIGLLVCDPMLVHSVGFRLSVAATSGLVVLTRPIRERLVGPQWLRLPLAVTLAAQTGAVPVMAATFGPVSVVAVPANLLAEPAAGLVMTMGMSTGLLSGVLREELAWWLQVPVRAAVWWVDAVAMVASKLSVPPVGLLGWSLLLLGAGSAAWLVRSRGSSVCGRAGWLTVIPLLVFLRPADPALVEAAMAGAADSSVGRAAASSVDHAVDSTVDRGADPAVDRAVEPGVVNPSAWDLGGPATLDAVCGRWILWVGARAPPYGGAPPGSWKDPGERAAVEIIESLWRLGVTRVALVVAAPDAPRPGEHTTLGLLSSQLRAEIALGEIAVDATTDTTVVGPVPGSEITGAPAAGGSGCTGRI